MERDGNKMWGSFQALRVTGCSCPGSSLKEDLEKHLASLNAELPSSASPQAPTTRQESSDGEPTTSQTQLQHDRTHQGDCRKLSATSASVRNQADHKTQPLPVGAISVKPQSRGGSQARAVNLGSDSPQIERGLHGAQLKPRIPGGCYAVFENRDRCLRRPLSGLSDT